MDAEAVSRLIGLVYDAAFDHRRWPDAVNRITDAVGATLANLGTFDAAGGVLFSVAPRADPAWVQAYLDRWAYNHELLAGSAHEPVGRLWTFESFVAREIFDRSAFYNEWWRPQGMEVALGANVLVEDGAATNLTVYRDHGRGAFTAAERRVFATLLPHLARAVQLRTRLAVAEAGRDASAAALDGLGLGVLLVSAEARVLFANSVATALLGEADGLRTEPGQRLAARRPADTAALRRLVAAAATSEAAGAERAPGRPLTLPRGVARTPLAVLVAPSAVEAPGLPPQVRPAAIVFAEDAERAAAPRADHLRALFGLTPAEAAVALRAARGEGLPAVAAALGIGRTTARSHLNAVFGKTGTRRQAELAWLLARLPP